MTHPDACSQVLAALRTIDGGHSPLAERICIACVQSLPVDGAVLSLDRRGVHRERVGASDEAAGRIQDLQTTLGEGPALESGLVLVSDVNDSDVDRWPAFGAAVSTTGYSAIFVLPLQIGAVRLGSLALYRRTPGALDAGALSDALRVADVISMLFLGSGGDLTEDFADRWLDQSSWTREVHQATGMVIAQLGVGAEEAFVRLRAHAFAHDLSLKEVAAAVVGRRLRLGDVSG